jgi:predicted CoA-substrate-specific enzyme activase
MEQKKETGKRPLRVGIDVGSTTTKVVVLGNEGTEVLLSDYSRHHAKQLHSIKEALLLVESAFPEEAFYAAITGSGAKGIAEEVGISYVQEVVANSIILKEKYREIGTAIELGGQDAKMIFFQKDKESGEPKVFDMRMNGSCAGGTGAFIDEIASLLKTPIEQFDALAAKGKELYDISGRCGVYAKTDIQPLLNQGVPKEDLALSSFHAIAKQTIGGLAQGLTIKKPLVFEGGPLTFNPTLVRVFSERLELTEEDILFPDHPELLIACGAALASNRLFTEIKEQTAGELLSLIEDLEERREKAFAEKNRLGESGEGTAAEESCASENAGEEMIKKEKGKAIAFFANEEEKEDFLQRHKKKEIQKAQLQEGDCLRVYLGIDSGSTTTKFVLLDEKENVVDSFYASNQGSPLQVAKEALLAMRDSYRKKGGSLQILAAGTTGYGEMLFAKAFSTESHTVETVAHARAAAKYIGDVSFLLDIGGQDMKAIWLDHGVITNIVVNEACSSGCGSFLENFAASLGIPAKEIANKAFSSRNEAELGSRCTVFMTSNIVTEQRNGKSPEDIMAGLCRSIIENVFTKVIRISNLDSLGEKIVVQGGTFENDAVLRAMEQYVGREVHRAPYPGIMGAIGAALLAKEEAEEGKKAEEAQKPHFISWEDLENLSWEQEANVPCSFCNNHCQRAVLRFSNGNSWITNNRCEKGEILGDPKEAKVREAVKASQAKKKEIPNLYELREKWLFEEYLPEEERGKDRNMTIGLPRVLSFWETMPFWTSFWQKLGFHVEISAKGSHKLFEEGLSAVPSDTICFPAKLTHGHIRDLARKKVDRIFMPAIAEMGSENTESTSESMCAIVKGYPFVIRHSDSPEEQWKIPFDAPLFYWNREEDKVAQLTSYMKENFSLPEAEVKNAILAGNKAMAEFKRRLKEAGNRVLEQVRKEDSYAVVLASRPYQNDELVNHGLPRMLTELGIPVLTADSLPGLEEVDLSKSRLDVVNNYHGRMLASAIMAAKDPHLQYIQLVSFGCGHDAYLSDEITRLMKEISGKAPLILKLDESEIQGPLRIRLRSFIETIESRRKTALADRAAEQEKNTAEQERNIAGQTGKAAEQREKAEDQEPQEPYPVKFLKGDEKKRIVLVPNTSHAFCRIMSAAISRQGLKAVPLEIGREEAIRLGKKYVHNDICFPAQIVIGEALAALKKGNYDPAKTAIGMGKYIGDCRLTHYSALLRKALDDAGYQEVAILTNDDVDYHDLHPGFRMNLYSALCLAAALPMIDILEELLRKIRPYEKEKGSSDQAFEDAMDDIVEGMEKHGLRGLYAGFKKAIRRMKELSYDRSQKKPGVLIVGEYLLNFHPGANHEIERYLEKNGFEIIEARMTDVIRKSYYCRDEQIRNFHLKKGFSQKVWYHTASQIFELAHSLADRIAKEHPLYQRATRLPELAEKSDPIIPRSFDAGEGILIPGEIIHHAEHGCKAFVILQPFGCLPNHVVGRGIVKKLRELYPDVQILSLDYDPDVSFANLENRLQMLVMNSKEKMKEKKAS